MGKKYFRKLAGVLIVVMLTQSVATMEGMVWKKRISADVGQEEVVSVSTPEEFLTALSQNKPHILVNGNLTIGDQADSGSGKMYPVEIPAGVTIEGGSNATLDCRCPIQLTGDNVTIKNLEILFSSSDALGSVPHREIFLAGYSLTLDNVATYLAGSGGSLGGLGGTEEELLPSVYAGGFENTSIGSYAQLTVKNGNSKTMFKAVYMSHEAEDDNKIPYKGFAKLTLSPQVVVREGVFTDKNSDGKILIGGSGNISDLKVSGNANTTMQIQQTSLYRAHLNGVENLVLEDGAYLELQHGGLENVILQTQACLDLNTLTTCTINGNFTGGTYQSGGQTDTRGTLVLNKEGVVSINGIVDNTTIFHTENRSFPGEYIAGKQYIKTTTVKEGAKGFVLPDSKSPSYSLQYKIDGWTVYEASGEEHALEIGSIDIISAPTQVDISKIKGNGLSPAEQAPYCSVYWKDTAGNTVSFSSVEDYGLYYSDIIIGVKSAYWNSDESLEALDWGNTIQFVTLESTPNQYYFYTEEAFQAKTGEYTFLFFSAYQELDENTTVADIKALKEIVKAEMPIYFYDSENGILAKPTETLSPTITVKPGISNQPMITETPGIPVNPGISNQPMITETPVIPGTSNQPTITEEPGIPVIPGTSNSPTITKEPGIPVIPGTSNQPTITETPSISMKPDTSNQPAITGAPDTTMKPETSSQPTITEVPSITMMPGTSITPDTTEVPEISSTPDIIGTPIPDHSHNWDLGEITKYPTVMQKGEKTYHCTICGQQHIEILPTLQLPEKGTVLTDKKTKIKYKVTKAGKKAATVEYIKSTKTKAKTVVIPDKVSIDGVQYKVASISSKAFLNCDKIKYVTIGKNVKKIGAKAFFGCKGLKKLTIKSTKLKKENIGENAFKKTNAAVIVKVPAKKLKSYQKIFKEKGLSSKVKFKK